MAKNVERKDSKKQRAKEDLGKKEVKGTVQTPKGAVKPMGIAGVGHKIILVTLVYFIATVVLSKVCYPIFSIPGPQDMYLLVGSGFLCLWLPLQIYTMYKLFPAYKKDQLVTEGTFMLTKHPLYVLGILLLMPGVSIMFASWLVLTTPIVMYLVYRAVIKEEEAYLYSHFGSKYQNYAKRVIMKNF